MIKIILDILFVLSKAAVIIAICYLITLKISSYFRYESLKRRYFKILVSSIICFIFFLTYGLLDNYYDLKNKSLAELWFLLFPISVLFIVIFSVLFFSIKRKP
jgi:hypothetical protein